ncbi:hypothetical protein [Xanthomonas cannabis]|uniref:hypothetical protein n=1 Tax=Xanthomonas cannabis TaxID=1885674 RepID=UPI0033AA6091
MADRNRLRCTSMIGTVAPVPDATRRRICVKASRLRAGDVLSVARQLNAWRSRKRDVVSVAPSPALSASCNAHVCFPPRQAPRRLLWWKRLAREALYR